MQLTDKPEEVFPSSLQLVLSAARQKDRKGKRSAWHMLGGEERGQATELYRMAATISEQVHGHESMQYVRVLKELAGQLESRHQERGRPENSRWNRAQAIVEDEISMESRYFFETALQVLFVMGKELTVEAAEIYVELARLVKPKYE